MHLKNLVRSFAFIVTIFLATANQSRSANEVPIGVSPLTLGGGASSVGLNTGYFQGVSEWLQVGASVFYQTLASKGVLNSHLGLLVGPQFNILLPYPEALTVHAGLVWRRVKTDGVPTKIGDDASGFGFGLLIGKRLPLVGNLILHPTVGVMSAGTFSFVATPARVSLNF